MKCWHAVADSAARRSFRKSFKGRISKYNWMWWLQKDAMHVFGVCSHSRKWGIKEDEFWIDVHPFLVCWTFRMRGSFFHSLHFSFLSLLFVFGVNIASFFLIYHRFTDPHSFLTWCYVCVLASSKCLPVLVHDECLTCLSAKKVNDSL